MPEQNCESNLDLSINNNDVKRDSRISEQCYEDFFNPSWFRDEPFITRPFLFDKVCIDLCGIPWDVVQKGAGYNRIGHTLWAAGTVLAEYLSRHPQLIDGKRILELGCGLGLTGLVAAKLSADPGLVVLTDGDENILDALQTNIDVNFPLWKYDKQPKCDVLFWGEVECQVFAEKHGNFDLILGADVLYDSKMIKPLLQTALSLLDRGKSSKLLVAFQTKYGGSHRDELLSVAHQLGFNFLQITQAFQNTSLLDGTSNDCGVELWLFTRGQ